MNCPGCTYQIKPKARYRRDKDFPHLCNCYLVVNGVIKSPIDWDVPENMCIVAWCWEPGNESIRLGTFTSYEDLAKWKPPVEDGLESVWDRAMRRRDACVEKYGRDAWAEAARCVVELKIIENVDLSNMESAECGVWMIIEKNVDGMGALAYLALHGTAELMEAVSERCEENG